MGTVLLRVPLSDSDGSYLVAEVDEMDLAIANGQVLVADDGDKRLATLSTSLSDAFGKLEPALDMIVSRLRRATRHPDEITVDFGLKLGGEAGLLFAKGTAEATLSVSVTWRHEPARDAAGQEDKASKSWAGQHEAERAENASGSA